MDRVTAGDDRLWELLRSLDDPEHLQFPPGYDHGQARSQFNHLVDRLDAAFSCSCRADRHVQDASWSRAALEDLGYTIVPEEPLWRPYDGTSRWFERFYSKESPPTWWIRFFDYL
jgi:hypothetical protein